MDASHSIIIEGDGTFRDVTETAGIHSTISARGMTFVDFDHDGDLDLYVTSAPATGASSGTTAAHSELWRNNGNGTFTNWSAESGLGHRGERRHGQRHQQRPRD